MTQLHSDQVLKFQHVSVLCLEEPLRRDEKFQILITKQKLPSTLQRLQMPSGVSLSLQVTMILRFSSKRLKGRFEGTCSCVTFWVRSGDAAEIFLRSSSISGPHPTARLAPKLPDSGGKCISFQSFDPKLTNKNYGCIRDMLQLCVALQLLLANTHLKWDNSYSVSWLVMHPKKMLWLWPRKIAML